jgi:excisionase family DNA binding protein
VSESEQQLLTVRQVAERLQYSRTWTWQLITSGQLRSLKLGPRSRRIREEDLDRFIRERQRASEAESR